LYHFLVPQLLHDDTFRRLCRRRDLLPVRFWVVQPYSNYLIVYVPEKKPLQIIRILHSARDLPALLP
jgi:plasmid stabilization system protein ParE